MIKKRNTCPHCGSKNVVVSEGHATQFKYSQINLDYVKIFPIPLIFIMRPNNITVKLMEASCLRWVFNFGLKKRIVGCSKAK